MMMAPANSANALLTPLANGLQHAWVDSGIRKMGEVSLGPKSWRQFGPSPNVPPLVRVFTEGHTATVRVKEDARVMYQMNDIEMMREHRQALPV